MRSLLFASVALLTSCSGGSNLRCVDDGDCDGIAVCNEVGLCQQVECTMPEHCNLGYTCGDENSCVTGCSGDDDCFAGETCGSSGQCEAYGCRSTQLDCALGETCNTATGQCEVDPDPHCEQGCTATAFGNTCEQQSPGAECACFDEDCIDTYCLVTCNPNDADPCPRGYSCAQVFTNTTQNFCYADCELINSL